MSTSTALGRYFQLNPQRAATARVSAIRCQRGCLLAEVLELDYRGTMTRLLLVHANTRNVVTDRNPLGVNATAIVAGDPVPQFDITALTFEQFLDAWNAEEVTLSQLERLYRESGLPLGKIAYVATLDDLQKRNANAFARCSHGSAYAQPEHLLNPRKRVRLETTPHAK